MGDPNQWLKEYIAYGKTLKEGDYSYFRYVTASGFLVSLFGDTGPVILAPLIKENAWQPYHNVEHGLVVFIHSMLIANSEGVGDIERKALALAALYHDFRHSGGEATDELNVKNACHGIREVFNGHIPDKLIEDACQMIQCTQYPYVIEPKTKGEMILREADIFHNFEADADKAREGLCKELKLAPGSLTIKSTIDFLSKQKIYTNTGKSVFATGMAALVIANAKAQAVAM